MTQEERALKMHDLALSVVRWKGVPRFDATGSFLEYRYGLLTVRYRSGQGRLDVWCVHKVLAVERFSAKPNIIRYIPGSWERVLVQAANVPA
jgi:hypothetical protein